MPLYHVWYTETFFDPKGREVDIENEAKVFASCKKKLYKSVVCERPTKITKIKRIRNA